MHILDEVGQVDDVCHEDLVGTSVLQATYFPNQVSTRISKLILGRYDVTPHDQESDDP